MSKSKGAKSQNNNKNSHDVFVKKAMLGYSMFCALVENKVLSHFSLNKEKMVLLPTSVTSFRYFNLLYTPTGILYKAYDRNNSSVLYLNFKDYDTVQT